MGLVRDNALVGVDVAARKFDYGGASKIERPYRASVFVGQVMDYNDLGAVARSIGEDAFYRNLMGHLGRRVGAEVQMVMRYSKSTVPTYVVHDDFDEGLMGLYLGGLYRLDPVYKLCKGGAQPGVYTLDSLGTSAKENARYASYFLSQVGMVDDFVVLFPAPASCAIALIFERSTPFASEDVSCAQEMFPLLLGMQEAHERMQITLMAGGGHGDEVAYLILDNKDKVVFESAMWARILAKEPALRSQLANLKPQKQQVLPIVPGYVIRTLPLMDEYPTAPGGSLLILEQGNPGMPALSPSEAVESFGSTVLTRREHDILRLIFLGYPNIKIAEKLNLSINTVKNHRKRMYSKLDITTERELILKFALPYVEQT